ncbi:MAG: fumarylacetoacetate hydrolase family protein [Ignavibacteria bacterium]|nr:fumarylacetoacetate hydrolase family protein [Ignavibacteria bacterium]
MSELKIIDSDLTLRCENIFCIGKNYADHISEMGDNVLPEEPVVFLKPSSSLAVNPETVTIPSFAGRKISDDLQNEVELVVVIANDCNNVSVSDADDFILGYAVGIDFTLRDLQSQAKRQGLPWTLSKGFRSSAPVSEIVLKENISDVNNLNISLSVNGEIRQSANTSQMIFKIDYIIHYLSYIFGLKKGDVIFTGTPSGVSRLSAGDVVKAEIESVGILEVKVE